MAGCCGRKTIIAPEIPNPPPRVPPRWKAVSPDGSEELFYDTAMAAMDSANNRAGWTWLRYQ